MKNTYTLFIAMALHFTTFAQTWTSPEKASKHIGNTVNLVGFINNVKYIAHAEVSRMSIEVNEEDSTPYLTLVVWRTGRGNFKEIPESPYLNQYVQVKGKVQVYKGKPHILLRNKKQISITREAFPDYRHEPL